MSGKVSMTTSCQGTPTIWAAQGSGSNITTFNVANYTCGQQVTLTNGQSYAMILYATHSTNVTVTTSYSSAMNLFFGVSAILMVILGLSF